MSPTTLITLFSVLLPVKTWFLPNQPMNMVIQAPASSLVLTDFAGTPVGTPHAVHANKDTPVDVHTLFASELAKPGTYVLYALSGGRSLPDFVGTPVVIEVRAQKHQDGKWVPMIVRVTPLCYAILNTDLGDMTIAFYYDVAANTVENFERLCVEGFYDGLTFHHIIPDFYLQGGDPLADGNGGAGFQLPFETNSKPYDAGVIFMMRAHDAMSEGSQFVICIGPWHMHDYAGTFTAFSRVVVGMDIVHKFEKVPMSQVDPRANRPAQPQYLRHLKLFPVTAAHNPYATLKAPW